MAKKCRTRLKGLSSFPSKPIHRGLAVFFLLAAAALPLQAGVKRIVIDNNESVPAGDKAKGDAREYMRINGKAYGEVDPADRRNAIINDIELAPRNARGMVEYVATFSLSAPKDLSKASGVLFYLAPNRGGLPAEPADLIARGDMILTSGWQGDIVGKGGAQSISVPVAKNKDGSSITGPVVTRFSALPAGTKTLSLPTNFLLASNDTAHATLTKRTSAAGAAISIAGEDWAFSDSNQPTTAPAANKSMPRVTHGRSVINPTHKRRTLLATERQAKALPASASVSINCRVLMVPS
jgi:hypothetical protein